MRIVILLALLVVGTPFAAAHWMPQHYRAPPPRMYWDWYDFELPSLGAIERDIDRVGPEDMCLVSPRDAEYVRWQYSTWTLVAEVDGEEYLVLLIETPKSAYRLDKDISFVNYRCRVPHEDGWAITLIDVPEQS